MTSTSTGDQPTPARPQTTASRTIWTAGLAAAGMAAAANFAVFVLARSAGAPLRVHFAAHQAATSVAAGHVLGATLAGVAVGTAVTALWLRRFRHGLAAARLSGAAAAVLSLAIPLSVHASPGTKAALAVMHLIAGAAFVAAISWARTRSVPSGRPATSPATQSRSAAYDKTA